MATLIVLTDLAAPAAFRRGGLAMYVLQWLHGLERLGHDVYFIEFLEAHPGADVAAVVRYFEETMTGWWRPERSALIVDETGESLYGLSAGQVARAAGAAAGLFTLAAPYRREPYRLVERA